MSGDRRPPAAGAALTYVYCVIRRARPPRLAARSALPGAGEVRALHVDRTDLWLLASHVPRSTYAEDALAARLDDLDWVSRVALAHEAVVRRAARQGAAVPLTLFTLFRDDARALASIGRRRAMLERVLARVGHCHEWGVRLALDAPPESQQPTARVPRSGREFLERKGRMRAHESERLRSGRLAARRLHEELQRRARDARRRTPGEGLAAAAALLLDAAYLVPKEETSTFRAEVRRLARRAAQDGQRLVLTGPWPPYHFVDRR